VVLGVLALHAGTVIPRDRLVDVCNDLMAVRGGSSSQSTG
jgi:hypothetical protein